jgi:hypothetical protein
MQRLTMVRYATKAEHTVENERLSRAVFDELREKAPSNVAYALFRNGAEFVHLFVNLEADDASQVTELPTFKKYTQNILERCEAPPEPLRLSLQLLDSYGLSGADTESGTVPQKLRYRTGTNS